MWARDDLHDDEFAPTSMSGTESAVEALVRSAVWMPQPTERFRTHVLATATTIVQQNQRRQRWQQTVSTGLAASLLFLLPSLFWDWQRPFLSNAPLAAQPSFSAAVLPASVRVADDYEWSLVQAALLTRSESSRMLRGAL